MAAFLKRLVLTTTVYPDVQRALQDPQHIPHFMRKMSESRNIALLIQCTFLRTYIQTGRTSDAAWTAALVLLTIHISFLYNNMSPSEVFQKRVMLVGSVTFTFLQTMPNVLVWILAVQEVIRSAPNARVGVVFVFLACIPLGFHIVCFEVIAYMRRRGGVDATTTGNADKPAATAPTST